MLRRRSPSWHDFAMALHRLPSFDDLTSRTVDLWRGVAGSWWVAGGWAIDLAIGVVTRAHDDIDVSVFRQELPAIRSHFGDWDLRVVSHGEMRRWNGEPLAPQEHQLWARFDKGPRPTGVVDFSMDPTFFELLIEDQMDGQWTYRRDPAVKRPLAEFGRTTQGIPFVGPAIQLLYKSKPHPKYDAKNDVDFDRCWPHLSQGERVWLNDSLRLVSPGHRWLQRLRRA